MPARLGFALLLGLVVLAACDGLAPSIATREGQPATLAGTAWRVVSVEGRTPVAGGAPTIAFDASKVSGSSGCNFFSGAYRYDGASGEIGFDNLGMTARACAEAARNEFETRFSQALVQANLVSVDAEGRLTLGGPGGAIVLEVDPQRAVEG
ncbi:MAG: putative lipoprotein [Gaiellales bacterium]|jgi:heat shock protein HslJ|nr:putative lipoprotein [Gaiellales bacterium]